MPKTANERYIKWIERYAGDSKPLVITEALKASIAQRMQLVFSQQVTIEDEVKLILGEAGLSSIFNGYYHAFAKQIFSLMGKFSSAQLVLMADVVLGKWVAKGLDRDILERVRNTIFALGAPASPPPTP